VLHVLAVVDSSDGGVEPLRVRRLVVKGAELVIETLVLLALLGLKQLATDFVLNEGHVLRFGEGILLVGVLVEIELQLVFGWDLIGFEAPHVLHHDALEAGVDDSLDIESDDGLEISIVLEGESVGREFFEDEAIQFNEHGDLVVFMGCLVKKAFLLLFQLLDLDCKFVLLSV